MKPLRFRVWKNSTAESIYMRTKDTINIGKYYAIAVIITIYMGGKLDPLQSIVLFLCSVL